MSYEKSFSPLPPTRLIANPLYQVNLLIWMLQPSTGAVVEPVLQKAGYRLFQIEPELSLPIELVESLQKNGFAHSNPVNPDLLICSPANDYIPLECKSRMFGSQLQPGGGDSQIKQARSLLLLIPPFLASALALQPRSVASSHVVYLAQHEPKIAQAEGLSNLSAELKKSSYRTIPFGLLGLSVEGNAIVLRGKYQHAKLPDALDKRLGKRRITVQKIVDDQTDPRPLYYLPWMPDNPSEDDEYSQQAFANRILAAAVSQIGPRKPPCEITLNVETLLGAATNNLYSQWRDKDVRKRLQKRAKELLKKSLNKAVADLKLTSLEFPEKGWKFEIPDQKIYSRVIEGLRKGEYKDWNNPIPQRSLFDEEDE
jgi:hypothetical protein